MIPLAVPDLTGNESLYLAECVSSTFVSSVGPFVDRFEEHLTGATGSAWAVATASGTSALHLALLAVGVAPGDLVVLPAYTFVASANAIRHAGAEPWLFDVTAESWTLDPDHVRDALLRDCFQSPTGPVHRTTGQRVAAIMPVYACGHPARMGELEEISAYFAVPIVADAAAAIGATAEGKRLGGLTLVSTLSFNGNKTVTSGGGGAVITSDEGVAELVRHLSTTARSGPGYVHDKVGFNYRMTNLQAAVGCAQVERLSSLLDAKHRIAARYREELAPVVECSLPRAQWAGPSDWLSGIVLRHGVSPSDFCNRMREEGIDARQFWVPMHKQLPYAASPRQPMDVTDSFSDRVVMLPCSAGLTEVEQGRVITAVLSLLSR